MKTNQSSGIDSPSNSELLQNSYDLKTRIEEALAEGNTEKAKSLGILLESTYLQLDPKMAMGAASIIAENGINTTLYPNLAKAAQDGKFQQLALLSEVPSSQTKLEFENQSRLQILREKYGTTGESSPIARIENSTSHSSHIADISEVIDDWIFEEIQKIKSIEELNAFAATVVEKSMYYHGTPKPEMLAELMSKYSVKKEAGEDNLLRKLMMDVCSKIETGAENAVPEAIFRLACDFELYPMQVTNIIQSIIPGYASQIHPDPKDAQVLESMMFDTLVFDPELAMQNPTIRGYTKELLGKEDENDSRIALIEIAKSISSCLTQEEVNRILKEKNISYDLSKELSEPISQDVKDRAKQTPPKKGKKKGRGRKN